MDAKPEQRIVVADVQMKFGSMVLFMVKWAIASIPAMLILVFLVSLAVGVASAGVAWLVSGGSTQVATEAAVPEAAPAAAPDLILARFEVTSARFRLRDGSLGPEPRVDLSVTNGTDRAVSRAYFVGRLVSAGRSVPWLEEEFSYQIPGGLEPGETAQWSLSPNQFSAWGRVEAPTDAVLEVTVTQLDGADGEAIATSR